MRRATGPMLVAWLLATFSAVGVAWVGVHPVADLGLADRPPVPQPNFAASPTYGDNAPAGAGLHGTGRAADGERTPSTAPSPTVVPTERSPSVKPPSTLPGPPSVSPSTPPDVLYREASTDGGDATFEYAEGSEVYVVEAEPNPGYQVSAYRYYRDWVVVEFSASDHTSTAHAYLDDGKPRLEVVEEDTTS